MNGSIHFYDGYKANELLPFVFFSMIPYSSFIDYVRSLDLQELKDAGVEYIIHTYFDFVVCGIDIYQMRWLDEDELKQFILKENN